MKAPRAEPLSTKPVQSKGRRSSVFRFGMKRRTRPTPRAAIGMFRKKIQGQSRKVTMKPPSAGPITGATSPGVVEMAMAATRSFFSVERSSTRLPTGVIRVAARACSTRAPTNCPRVWLMPQSAEAKAKPAMAAAKT